MAAAALVWAGTAAAQPGPQIVVAARERAVAGDPSGAAGIVEAWLARDSVRLSPGDAAAVHLEAARHAAAASQRDRAARHLNTAARLGAAFQDLALQARFKRELARVWERLGTYQSAKPLLEAALATWPGTDPAGAAEAANALGTANLELRQPTAAVDAYRRSLALLEKAGSGAPAHVTGWVNLVTAALQADNPSIAADAAGQAALAAGDAPPLRRAAAFARAQVLLREPDLPGAEALLQRISDEAGASEAVRGHALFLLATTRFNRGRAPEALTAGLAAVSAYRSSLGDWHPALARALHLVGTTYGELRDRASAVSFLRRSTEIAQRAFGPASPQVQATAMEWAWVELQGGDMPSAGRRMVGVVLALAPPAQPDPRTAGLAQIMLGLLAEGAGKLPDAVDRYRAGQRLIAQASMGEADLSFSLVRLGRLLTRMGRLAEAGPPLDQAVARYEKLGSAGTARMADALVARAEWRAARGDRRGALDESRRGFAMLQGGLDAGGEGGAFRRGAREAMAAHARLLVGIHDADPTQAGLLAEAFEVTQDALASRTGEALRQASLRQAAGTGPVASLLRDRAAASDAVAYLSVLEGTAVQRPGAEAAREAARLRDARAQQAAALAVLDARLQREMPDFGAYARPRPAPLREVQDKLPLNTAAVATLATSDGLLVWTLTRDGAQATVVPITETALAGLVRRVRAGVDGRGLPDGTSLPAFDVDAAQALHRALLDPAKDLLAGKTRLVFVADGALQSVPPALLVGAAPGDWLVRRFAVSVMPSLGSIAVQGGSSPPLAEGMFLGIGDPELPAAVKPSAPILLASRGVPSLREALAGLSALPETRVELQRIANLFPPDRVRLMVGQDATKAGLAGAAPGGYRILAFATHAVMAGELPGVPEPAIVLSPGEVGEAAGLLTASDVSVMRLNADLVLLSACNTAAPDGGPYAEGFSGLARAFLQAGARSLLVSHWAVDSLGTVELTTGFMAALQEEPKGDKAIALQAVMVRLLSSPDVNLRHPAIWAPFVLVGG